MCRVMMAMSTMTRCFNSYAPLGLGRIDTGDFLSLSSTKSGNGR